MVDRAVVEDLDAVWSSLAELGDGLTERDWPRPTDCPGWSVRDQVSHVVGTEAWLSGQQVPESASDHEHVRNELGAFNEAWVDAYRDVSGPELLRRFARLRELRLAALRGMSDEQLLDETEGPVGRMPYQDVMRIRVMDCWVHEQDVRHAVGRPGGMAGSVAESAVDTLLRSLGFVVAKKVRPPEGAVIALRMRGPVERARSIEFTGGRGRVVDEPGSVTSAVSLDTTTFARLAAGRWTPEHPEAAFEVTGDDGLGRSLVRNLATTP